MTEGNCSQITQIFTDTFKSVLIREISENERKSFLDFDLIS